ncbi:MAG: LysR substrate-binding domain-containing protein [Salinisphaera sp.]|nr:LysR substrate-binding domain-containing protein [Salinisphaera sp.]
MHLSQAAVSQALRELADALDVTLFTRAGRELQPTASARQLLALSEAPRAALIDIGAPLHGSRNARLAGPVHIAASSTIARYVLPVAVAGLIQAYPELRLSLTSGNSADVEIHVADGKADIGFIEGPSARDDLKASRWRTDALVVIGPADAPEALDPDKLSDHAGVAREAGSGTRSVFEHALALAGMRRRRRPRSTTDWNASAKQRSIEK